ncbi:DDE superfamily endonuclease [Actinokineospora auranticolor]|uniref:DDE superfamily endonuclease n=1 Tax=Actinokineospora auranticolor TaxID=155976 RepID=A0A2S6H131_9PSEU|nr:DDE superfamily endonuclease [Actinokineospora auranticolor]
MDGTRVPTRDHRLAARSKNHRYSTNPQVAIDADTRLVIATGEPKPGNRNDCTVYRDSGIADVLDGRPVMADGGYQGNPEVIGPYRKPRDSGELADWQEDLNTVHRSIRARAEHALARMKNWTILRDYRRAAHTLRDTASDIAHLHNLTLTGWPRITRAANHKISYVTSLSGGARSFGGDRRSCGQVGAMWTTPPIALFNN